jgi:N-acetylneuraminate synthase/sialic acid synthase
MIKTAALCGVDAVKFQKRDSKVLYTNEMYHKPYESEDSFGHTYGEHREFLEFKWDEYVALKKSAEENNLEFMCTPFDFESIDFLERLGITSYKIASGDLTNTPLLKYVAKLGKPMFLSTGASSLQEIHLAYDTVAKYNDKICLLHTTSCYPTDYPDLNLSFIRTLKKDFPEAVIGYSSHDNGILAASIAYMLGATVIEKHFTINHSWKGTDHKFSLEPEGLRKQVRDLKRIEIALGDGKKIVRDIELQARVKMGKSLYTARALRADHTLAMEDIVIKSPGGGLAPYYLDKVIGSKTRFPLKQETMISFEQLEMPDEKKQKLLYQE